MMKTIKKITRETDLVCSYCEYLIDGALYGYHCLKACRPDLENDTCLEYTQKED